MKTIKNNTGLIIQYINGFIEALDYDISYYNFIDKNGDEYFPLPIIYEEDIAINLDEQLVNTYKIIKILNYEI